MSALLSDDEITRRLSDLEGWTAVSADGASGRGASGASALRATFELDDFAGALAFVNQVGHEAEQMNHHPDIDIRWNTVTLTVSTHSAGGVTGSDFDLAHRIASATGFGQPL